MARSVEAKRSRRAPLKGEQRKEIVCLYESGLSGPKIADKLNLSSDQVYLALKKEGVERDVTGARNRRWTDEQEEQIADAYIDGARLVDLAKEWKTSPSAISKVLRRTGTQTRYKKREFTEQELQAIRARYEAGEPAITIAATYKVGHKRVISELRQMGVKKRRVRRVRWTDKRGRVFTFRSLWEAQVAKWLDAEGYEWDYEKERYILLEEDKTSTYLPDFWVYDEHYRVRTIIEVKGRWTGTQRHRVALFREQYPHFTHEVWDGQMLREMGLLDAAYMVVEEFEIVANSTRTNQT